METRTIPSGRTIDVVKLERIRLEDLESGNLQGAAKLLEAAQSVGMFYLDFGHSSMGDLLLEKLGEIYYVSQNYFDQSNEYKVKDIRYDQKPNQDKGYKHCETDETFEMSYDELVKGNLELPEILSGSRYTMKDFSEICQATALRLVQILSVVISASPPFETHNMKSGFSDSGLKLVYEPCVKLKSEVVENKHTDSGTCTLLFYDEWGLHVQLPDGKWGYVEAKPGCAVVNIADSLQKLSGGRLRSPLHRVTQPDDGFLKRYFLSYFLRPT